MGLRKKCKLCNLTKPASAFNPNAEMLDGRRNECKICLNKKKLTSKKKLYRALSDNEKEQKRKEWRDLYSERILYHQKRYQGASSKRSSEKWRFADYKRGAKYRGLDFEIQFDEFCVIVNSDCSYCGGVGGGIDRVDPLLGYQLENCAPCCKRCNRIKSNYQLQDLMEHLKKIVTKWETV